MFIGMSHGHRHGGTDALIAVCRFALFPCCSLPPKPPGGSNLAGKSIDRTGECKRSSEANRTTPTRRVRKTLELSGGFFSGQVATVYGSSVALKPGFKLVWDPMYWISSFFVFSWSSSIFHS
jgi:hypothetical protein